MYNATQLLGKKEKEELQLTFTALDKNGDGKLSRAELIEGYTKLYGDSVRAIREVNSIMTQVDVDGNGFIDYSGGIEWHCVEFLIASSNKKNMLSKENLRKTFQQFDKVSCLCGRPCRTAMGLYRPMR